MNLSYKTKYIHLFFISLLAIHYLLPLIFIGQIAVYPHDNLDGGVVYDHIIGKIYKGDLESISYFLSGKIKWYYIEELFYPINILHYFLEDKLFYFSDGILKKILAYFSFYLLAKSLNITKFNSALGGFLFATIVNIKVPLGIGLTLSPYLIYLLVNKDTLDKKHYFFLFLIGLNSSLIQDFFVFISLIPLAFILKDKSKNLNIYLQVFSVIIISSIISNIHLVIGSVLGDPIHREVFPLVNLDIFHSFPRAFKDIFFGFDFKNYMFIFKIPLIIIFIILLIVSFSSKHKKMRLIFYFIIFILILKSIVGSNLLNNFYVGMFDILRGFNFKRLDKILPVLFALLFIFYISSLKNKNLKNCFYIFSLFSVISLQLITPLPVVGEYFLKNNMYQDKFDKAKKSISEGDYIQSFKIIFSSKNYVKNTIKLNDITNKTFDNYYQFENYALIKNIVKNSRVMSVGLNPMIAVMNDIKVIDGYHSIYPLNYKIKFRKIIENELNNNSELKNYYDDWGSRVYAFYSDKNNIVLNFQAAKNLGADYVISKFPIKNKDLEIVCFECNNSDQIFLYKIN